MLIVSLSGWSLVNFPPLQQEPSLTPSQKVERALRLCQSKQYEAAKAIAHALVQSSLEYEQLTWEEQIALHRCLALCYSVEGHVDLADQQFKIAHEIRQRHLTPPSPPPPPPTPAQKLQQVVQLCRQKQFEAAQPIAEGLLQTESEYQSLDDFDKTILHYCLVQIYSAQGRMTEAEEQIKQVQAIRQTRAAKPSHSETLAERVREVLTLCELANLPEAKSIAEAILQDPHYADLTPSDRIILHRCLAQIYVAEGDDERAAEQFRQILAINPRFALRNPDSPLNDLTSPKIEQLFDSVKPKPSSAVLTLGGLGLAALIARLRGGTAPGEPDPNQFTFTVNPGEIAADGESSAVVTLQIRDNFGRLVTNDSETHVKLSIPNPGRVYQIRLEVEKGTQIIPAQEDASGEIRGEYRVNRGELVVRIKITAPAETPAGVRRTFDIAATTTPGGTRQVSLITVAPDIKRFEIPLYMGVGDSMDHRVIAILTNAAIPEVFNERKEDDQGITLRDDQGNAYEKLAKKLEDTVRWTVMVRTTAPSVTLFWLPDLLPVGYNFGLDIDLDGNPDVDMRSQSEYPLIITAGSREFRLIASKTRAALASVRRSAHERVLITALTARPTRGGQLVVTFSLSRPAQVRASLQTMSGQTLTQFPVRNATRGLNTLMLWDERLGKAPPGTYLLVIEASSEDGTITRATTPVLVTR